MATTQELETALARSGAVASGRFTADGKLVEKRSKSPDVTDELAAIASQFAATMSMVVRTFAASYSVLSGIPLVPFHGWIFTGGEMTAVVQNDLWTMLRTRDSSFTRPDSPNEKTLQQLLACNGVKVATYYTSDGRVIAHAKSIPLSQDLREAGTQIVASVVSAADGLSTAFGRLAKNSWSPFEILLYSGGDWTIAATKTRWVLADSGECSIEEIYQALPW